MPTPQTPKAMTNKTDKNQYLPTQSTPPQAGPDTKLLSESEGPVGPPLPSLPSVDIHKEEHLLSPLTEVY